jgi:hypothetical protein
MTMREITMLVEDYLGTSGGYLNYFSYSEHESFYHTYCDLEVDVAEVRKINGTTRKAFIAILKDAVPRDQAKIIRGTLDFRPLVKFEKDEKFELRSSVHAKLLAVAARLEGDGHVAQPVLSFTTETVAQALKDAELLLNKSGPSNAVDRAHTAVHGYLKGLCAERKITVLPDTSLTGFFKILREQFPEFSGVVAHDNEAKRVFGSIATALDSLNTIRNRGTLAHPNEILLEAAEAMLFINLSRAALGYIDTRVKTKKTPPQPVPPWA